MMARPGQDEKMPSHASQGWVNSTHTVRRDYPEIRGHKNYRRRLKGPII